MEKKTRISIDYSVCTSCMKCVDACPKKAVKAYI
ncbi:MAG TPA: hypothetical protein ENI15_19485 [Spirochaetes bacterium]|nr:hypothetical protein [Spirochaetota bacterium]